MAQRRGNNAGMNGYNGRRHAYFLADKPDDIAQPDAGYGDAANGKPLGVLGNGKARGSAYGAEAKKAAKVVRPLSMKPLQLPGPLNIPRIDWSPFARMHANIEKAHHDEKH